MPDGKILNEAIIDELRNVLGDGFQELCQEQVTQANACIEDIRSLMAKGDMVLVSRRAHSLKSSAGQVGLVGVQSLAKDLEEASLAAAEGGAPSPRAMEAFARLVREHDVAVKSLSHYVSRLAHNPT